MIVAKRYSTPCTITNPTITTAIAPVAPEIIPLLPPKTEVIKPTKKAAYKPTNGSTWATKANAIASGTRARATVSPDRMSFLGLETKLYLDANNLNLDDIKELQNFKVYVCKNIFTQRTTLYEFIFTYNLKSYINSINFLNTKRLGL